MDRRLRELVADGLELLGEIELGGVVSVGDPVSFLGPAPSRVRVRVKPGRWHLLGRAWDGDPALLGELIAVHEDALSSFYDLYDACQPAGEAELGSGRAALLDDAIAGDDAVLRSLYEPEELPWILDRGWVAEEVPGGPAWLLRPPVEPTPLLSVALGPTPPQQAPSLPEEQDSRY